MYPLPYWLTQKRSTVTVAPPRGLKALQVQPVGGFPVGVLLTRVAELGVAVQPPVQTMLPAGQAAEQLFEALQVA